MEQAISRKKILVVDDEPNIRQLSRKILTKKFDVLEAEDGRQAIEIAGTQQPDVILMDMMMPKMDGLTACYAIRNGTTTKSIPVVMVTAIGFDLNIKFSQQMGANAYLTKPFNAKDLLDKITQVISTDINLITSD
jgi:CheY-like chemotaxis protein